MENDSWRKVEAIVGMTLEQAPHEQSTFLDATCAGDEALRDEVMSLLALEDKTVDFLEAPAVEFAAELFTEDSGSSIKEQRIGAYKLLREIGRGGMGMVYLAARADELYEKQVAIKLIRRGLDTEDILRRFRNERQILANLDHPNIARLLDGGTTGDGVPYLVMDYVEGVQINEYADAHKLSITERLKLFRAVCAAVQYAHQHLVIHRDIKPGNILITSEGTPKLLDFGIAKLLDSEQTQNAAHTITELRAMTPEYASPEQVRGETVTTATDIYSLGVLLYELLTGHRPYRIKNRRPDEAAQIICEEAPEKPSRVISHTEDESTVSGKPATLHSLSLIRGAVPEILRRLLSGDLDNIILMAMRKEASRRYASVEQFSADIKRHLDGLPVIARKDTFKYRATKFVRRNRLGVAAAAIILLSLLGGMMATIWQAREARAQAQAARAEKAKAESVSAFLANLLKYSNPLIASTSASGGEITMKDVLDEAAKRLGGAEFANQPEVRAELEKIIADSYYGQGRNNLSEQHFKEYVRLQQSLYGEHDPQAIEATAEWAGLLFKDQNLTESEKVYRLVLPLMRSRHLKGNIKAQDLATALRSFGYLRRTQGDSMEAEAAFREMLSLSPELPDEERYWIGITRSTLASTLADQGKFDEALETAREAVLECRQTKRTNTPDFGFVLTVYGGFLTDKGNYAEADAILKEAETLLRGRQSSSSLWLGDTLRNQAISCYRQGKYAESQSKATETGKIYLESFGPSYDNYPTMLIIKGLILDKTGKSHEGEIFLREAARLRVESLPKDHFWTAVANSALGKCLTTQKRFIEAEPLLIESYHTLNSRLGQRDPRTIESLRRLVSLYQDWNKPEQAAQYRALS